MTYLFLPVADTIAGRSQRTVDSREALAVGGGHSGCRSKSPSNTSALPAMAEMPLCALYVPNMLFTCEIDQPTVSLRSTHSVGVSRGSISL